MQRATREVVMQGQMQGGSSREMASAGLEQKAGEQEKQQDPRAMLLQARTTGSDCGRGDKKGSKLRQH